MEIFDAILKANQGLQGRVQGIQYGIVSDTKDPLRLGRIQVFDAAKGGKSTTDWLIRVLPFPGFSPPLPLVGDTVLIGYIDGNPHDGIYFGSLQNAINPVINQGDDLVIQVGQVKVTIKPSGELALEGVTTLNTSVDTVAFTDVSSFTINGKEVLTIGSVDTRGDTNNTKGW